MAHNYSPNELAKLALFDRFGSVTEVQRNFTKEFDPKSRRKPNDRLIQRCHARLLETGSVLPGKRGRELGVKLIRTQSTEQRVLAAYDKSPQKSLRRGALELGLSKNTIHRILRERKLKPYKIQILQKINDEDKDRRLEFAEEQLEVMTRIDDYLDLVIFSDECIFCLDGRVNKQNCRYWSDENPHFYAEQPLHSPKLTIWCGIWSGGIIGPAVFEETVNGDNYLELLKAVLWPAVANHPRVDDIRFQQDGAPPHFARAVRNWLDDNFEERWIGRRGPTEWPPRSPDLTPCDFFLWGYLKSVVYKEKPTDLAHLRQKIEQTCRETPQEMIDRSLVEFKNRLQKCVENAGDHIEQFL